MTVARMPALFLGHGNPMNALADNSYTQAWSALGKNIPRPTAILCVSAHWYGEGTFVTAMARPRTIHDFGGFPRELFEAEYNAPGDPALASRVRDLLHPVAVGLDDQWGLDHGAWSVLTHVYPDADVPVVQLSMDETQSPAFHFEMARRLAPLREEGVLIIGSGNLVHNLHAYAWGRHPAEPFDWALRFEKRARDLMETGDISALLDYESLGNDARLSIPTPEHFLPLLYILATRSDGERVTFPVSGMDGGSISMLAAQIG